MLFDENAGQCPVNTFHYYSQLSCYQGDSPYTMNMIYFSISLINLIASLYILKASYRVKRQITEPKGDSDESTYCMLTVKVLVWTQYMLVITIVLLVYTCFAYAIGPKYGDWILTDDFKNCGENRPMIQGNLVFWISTITLLVKFMVTNIVTIYQIFEWHSISFLVKFQLDKDEREILQEHLGTEEA